MKLSYDDVKRYIAHIHLKKIGIFGQKKIINTKILIIGVGGLGSPVALYLASSGFQNIGIVDHDKVDISNLHRQILFNEEDVKKFKVDAATKKLKKINSKIKIKKFCTKINSININKIAKKYDLIIDGTDSFRSKLLINDYCAKNKKILVTYPEALFEKVVLPNTLQQNIIQMSQIKIHLFLYLRISLIPYIYFCINIIYHTRTKIKFQLFK